MTQQNSHWLIITIDVSKGKLSEAEFIVEEQTKVVEPGKDDGEQSGDLEQEFKVEIRACPPKLIYLDNTFQL